MSTELVNCDQKGSEMSLYYDTADDPSISGGSSCTTPVWVYNKAVTGDMSIADTEDESELSARDPEMTYKQYAESKPDLEVTGELLIDPDYDGFRYLNAMRAGSYGRNILVLTTYLTNVGAIGFKGKFRNFDRTLSGPETGAGKQNFKLKPAACVKVGCKITPIKVTVSGTAGIYDPGIFTTTSIMSVNDAPQTLGEVTVESVIFQALTKKDSLGNLLEPPTELFTDIGPLITLLGIDVVDKLLTSLVETSPISPEKSLRSARRSSVKATGMGGFEGLALRNALLNIVGNDEKTEMIAAELFTSSPQVSSRKQPGEQSPDLRS